MTADELGVTKLTCIDVGQSSFQFSVRDSDFFDGCENRDT